jgi:hypothetical protein
MSLSIVPGPFLVPKFGSLVVNALAVVSSGLVNGPLDVYLKRLGMSIIASLP